MSTTKKLHERKLIQPPDFVVSQLQYETLVGSITYGVSTDTSDIDTYGFCIPRKEMVFPHLAGEILGFGRQLKRFDQFIGNGVCREDNGKVYDLTIYSIIKFFQLCMDNNPNMIDCLFTATNYITHMTKVGQMVREARKDFLHKGAWHKFKGYAYSQMNKAFNKTPIGKRVEIVNKYGYDIKFAYHIVRLLGEVEQILSEGDMDLLRNREQLKSIRRGEWSEADIRGFFERKEKELESLYLSSKLRHSPDEDKIKKLLINCLEEHFGSLEKCVVDGNKERDALNKVHDILIQYYSEKSYL